MTVQSQPATETQRSRRRPLWPVAWMALAVALVIVVACYARVGAVSPRIRNPEVTGAPRPVRTLFGFEHWNIVIQLSVAAGFLAIIAAIVVAWRRKPGSPVALMGIVTTLLVWQDPIMNWASYAVYNPALWHWPEDWPLFSTSPTVEPFIVIVYVVFFLGPYFPAIWVLRRVQARRPVDSFASRHPLVALAALIFVIGFAYDVLLEISALRTGAYIYSQVVPFGSVFVGSTYQFPLLWQALVTLVMIPAGVLLYCDDTGRTVAEKVARRARVFPERPILGTFVVMLAIVNVAYFGYGLGYSLLKWTHAATSVACPWPYPEAKVYDPQGFYEANGQQGPFFAGKWSTWMTGQPDGRPAVHAPADGGRC